MALIAAAMIHSGGERSAPPPEIFDGSREPVATPAAAREDPCEPALLRPGAPPPRAPGDLVPELAVRRPRAGGGREPRLQRRAGGRPEHRRHAGSPGPPARLPQRLPAPRVAALRRRPGALPRRLHRVSLSRLDLCAHRRVAGRPPPAPIAGLRPARPLAPRGRGRRVGRLGLRQPGRARRAAAALRPRRDPGPLRSLEARGAARREAPRALAGLQLEGL